MLKPNVRYRVTRRSDNGTFEVNDIIMLDDYGSINNYTADGWIDTDDAAEALQGAEYTIDDRYYQERRRALTAELVCVTALLRGPNG